MPENTPVVPVVAAKAAHANKQYQTLSEFLTTTETALTNATGTDILPLLVTRGYTAIIINGKLADAVALRLLDEKQRKEYGDQYDATEKYNTKRTALNEDYADHIALARIAFKDDISAQTALGLKGKRKESVSGFSSQGLLFYNGIIANTSYKAAIAIKGVDAAELTTMQVGFTGFRRVVAAGINDPRIVIE